MTTPQPHTARPSTQTTQSPLPAQPHTARPASGKLPGVVRRITAVIDSPIPIEGIQHTPSASQTKPSTIQSQNSQSQTSQSQTPNVVSSPTQSASTSPSQTERQLALQQQVATQLRMASGLWVLEQPTPDVQSIYTFGSRIGQPGQFGYAIHATDKRSSASVAIKVISKNKFQRAQDRQVHFKELRSEIAILQTVHHPNIISLIGVYESAAELYIVTELCTGGELFDRIKAQPKGSYNEHEASQILRQICQGIKFLHDRKIAHCDLKPDNFGMSKFVKRRQYFHALRGTPYYIAPEVIQGHYNEACDMWSLGVIMFVMLFGYPPFHADSDAEIFKLISAGFNPIVQKGYKAHFPASIPCSDSAKDLISKLLTRDMAQRLTADETLNHPWMTGVEASEKPMVEDVIRNLKSFTAVNKFKQGVLELMSNTLTETDLVSLKKQFVELDANGDGRVTVSELAAAIERDSEFGGV